MWFPHPGEMVDGVSDETPPLKQVMLFDIDTDPQERKEISHQHPEIVKSLLKRLEQLQEGAQPINFPPDDPRCDPQRTGAWGPWQ